MGRIVETNKPIKKQSQINLFQNKYIDWQMRTNGEKPDYEHEKSAKESSAPLAISIQQSLGLYWKYFPPNSLRMEAGPYLYINTS